MDSAASPVSQSAPGLASTKGASPAADPDALQTLVRAALASEAVFRRACRDVLAEPDLKAVFERYADQRAAFALVLRANLEAVDPTRPAPTSAPPPSGPTASARGLIDANETIAVDLSVSVLDRCLEADADLARAYTNLLDGPLSPELHVEAQRQLVAVTDGHDHLKSLDHAFRMRALGTR